MLIGVIAEELLLPSESKVIVAAASATATETAVIVFSALINEPASASDAIYIGEFLGEPANAVAVTDAGYLRAGTIVETATADSSQDGSTAAAGVVAGAIDETATAVSAQDAATAFAAAIAEAATAVSTQDATVVGAVAARSAMLMDVFVNTGTSREANVNGTMVNI